MPYSKTDRRIATILFGSLIAASVLFAMMLGAKAQLTTTFAGGKPGGAPPPVCSNKLDFSKVCNSQYMGMM